MFFVCVCLRIPPFPTSAVLKSAAMVMAIFLKWSPFRCNGGGVKVVLGRGECEDYVELPHVRVALQCPVYLCVCVHLPPPPPHCCSPRICGVVVVARCLLCLILVVVVRCLHFVVCCLLLVVCCSLWGSAASFGN